MSIKTFQAFSRLQWFPTHLAGPDCTPQTIDMGVPNPTGLAFSPRSELFYMMDAPFSAGMSGIALMKARTPDLSPIIQEIVNRSGWGSGGAIAFLITGTGHRTAVTYDGSAAGAPLLHVEYH